jgi:hypothetical protein
VTGDLAGKTVRATGASTGGGRSAGAAGESRR